MQYKLNPKWINEMNAEINATRNDTGKIFERILTYPPSKAWLVTALASYNIPFKVYNLGAGVSRITTDTDTCPCCKKPL